MKKSKYIIHIKKPYQQYYSRSYTSEAAFQVNKMAVKALREKLSGIPFRREHKVLDIACGVSVLGKTFGTNVYGIDINKEAVSAATKNGIKAKLGDVEKKWKYPTGYFDIVIASHIIEHLVNPDHLFLETKRVLKKNGTLIIVTPNLAAWFNRVLLLFGFQPFFSEVSTLDKTLGLQFTRNLGGSRNPLGHLRVFTPSALRDILELHGFKIVKTGSTEFGSFPPMLACIDKLFAHIYSLAACIFVVAKKL